MSRTHCKFQCTGLASQYGGNLDVTLDTRYDDKSIDDQSFSKATPSGKITINLANPKVFPMFELGKQFRVIIEEIE